MNVTSGRRERPLRVLELLTSTSVGGGPAHVYDLVTRLPLSEFTPIIGAPRDGPYFDRFLTAGVETMELSLNRVRPWTLGQTIRLIHASRADLVHTHGKGAGLYGRLAARWARVPAVHTFHGIHYLGYGLGVGSAYLSLERTLSRMTRVVINVSRSQAEEGETLRLARPGQGVVIVNGVDVTHVRRLGEERPISRASLGLAEDDLVLGCITRFDHVKRMDTLLDMLRALGPEFPRLHLVLAGGGGGQELGLRQRAAGADLRGRVTFLNVLADAPRLLRAVDVYVSASSREGLPLALLEAMGAGLPVVATRVPGNVDTVDDGVTGFLVRADDPADMAEAVARLLRAPDLRARMGAAGLERARRLFSVERMVDETARVYRAVIGAGMLSAAGTVAV
jgi:glycosyltransferase involved in cell wall biosynthesis